jgi:hypothetical protein
MGTEIAGPRKYVMVFGGPIRFLAPPGPLVEEAISEALKWSRRRGCPRE